MDTGRTLDAVERGQSATDFADFLQRHDSQELPEMVEAFLLNAARDGQALKTGGEATFIHCRDAETATLLCDQKELHGHCHRCGDTLLAVTTVQMPRFRKVVRSVGLGVV